MPSLQSEISILNAEKYGEEPRRTRSANGKRSLSEDHDDDDDDGVQKKRSRGRPRLDTKDETAADVSTLPVCLPACLFDIRLKKLAFISITILILFVATTARGTIQQLLALCSLPSVSIISL